MEDYEACEDEEKEYKQEYYKEFQAFVKNKTRGIGNY
jgi:hypothetical protein